MSDPKPTSDRFYSPSTDPLLQKKTLQFPQRGTAPLWRLSQPQTYSTQAS